MLQRNDNWPHSGKWGAPLEKFIQLFRQFFRADTVVKVRHIFAIRAHEINERRMVDGIVAGRFISLDLGLALVAFFAVLVLTSWSLGLLSAGVILRYGLGAEEFAWSLAFILLPLSCVYYPVSVLPDWLKPIALALPPTHVFEGMRSILLHHVFNASELWWALGLNAVYLTIGYLAFRWFLQSARVNGTLLQLGE